MSLVAAALLAQLAAPVLAFPEPGMDDSAAYQGYQTRFYRDAARNTLQVYLDQRTGRVVHLWADAENESIGFSVRGSGGDAPALRWGTSGATVGGDGRTRTLTHGLVARGSIVRLGWFLLGSMRVERDFQAWGRHRAAFNSTPFLLEETRALLAALQRLPSATRRQHLSHLGAGSVATVRARTRPHLSTRRTATEWTLRVVQPSLDARDTIALEVRVDPRLVAASRDREAITLRAITGREVAFTLQVSTTGRPLTPLARDEIFTPEFLAFLAATTHTGAGGGPAGARARWMERQVRGVELLSSREKLMAGLPTYATYFGRDMLVSALMMRPIWRDEMTEFALASALRKLSPSGQVSHEEALGGQAVREAAAEYAGLVDRASRARREGHTRIADSLVDRAATVLRDHRRVRENYHMIDDELQLPVLAARWLADPRVGAARKRSFLLDSSDGHGTRLSRLMAELGLVAHMTAAYAGNPVVANLISFAPRANGGWASTSWRDSNAGYAGGRYAMDVNAIWAPQALAALHQIVGSLTTLGFDPAEILSRVPGIAGSPLARYVGDPALARAAAATWRGALRHFLVRLGPPDVQSRVASRLAAMPAVERRHWQRVLARTGADRDSLEFLALSLDSSGRPIGVANTDPATRLFLGEADGAEVVLDSATMASTLRDVRPFVRPYPVGLFIERVGPVVANDAFAAAGTWTAFERDPYHGPRVAWGREVNLFLLGVANLVATAGDTTAPPRRAFVRELQQAAATVVAGVEGSGFHSELWSYAFTGGVPAPARYGSGADVQLWSTTDLAVHFALSRMAAPR